MKKTELFQLQKFYSKRNLWDDCFPEFVEQYKKTEVIMKSLEGQSFSATAKPRIELMTWFIEKIKNINNIHEIMDKINDDEIIPDGSKWLTKKEFINKYYGNTKSVTPVIQNVKAQPVFRMVANFHAVGGGELSAINIMTMFIERGYQVLFHPTKTTNGQLVTRLPQGVEIQNSILGNDISGESDVFFIYSNDFVYNLKSCKGNIQRLMDGAKRSAMCINFVIGESWQEWISSRMNKVMFLNSTKEQEYLDKLSANNLKKVPTKVLAPPVFFEPYLKIKPDYSKINFVRTGRHGGKYDEGTYLTLMDEWMKIVPDAQFYFMATPPFIQKRYGNNSRVNCYNWDNMTVADVLSKGSLFHYHLPRKMRDQGPRVIVEAFAAGIPCCAENRDGTKDRLTEETGWFCNDLKEFIDVVRIIKDDIGLLKLKGEAARERAICEFNPYRWYDEIIS